MPTATMNSKPRRLALIRGRKSDADGSLVLRGESGDVIHVSPTSVSSTLRSTVARLRISGELPRRLGVTSAIRGEGVTFISRSLALVLASDLAAKVCIVDLNWWSSTTEPEAENAGPGLAGVLRRSVPVHQAVTATGTPGLFVLPAGPLADSERPIVASSPDLSSVLDELEHGFDHVLLDLPAIHPTGEALTLAGHADSLVLVVRHGVTLEEQVRLALEQLDGLPVLGVVLNDYTTKVPGVVTRHLPPS